VLGLGSVPIQGARRPSVYNQTAGERRACERGPQPHSFDRRPRSVRRALHARRALRPTRRSRGAPMSTVCVHDCNILCCTKDGQCQYSSSDIAVKSQKCLKNVRAARRPPPPASYIFVYKRFATQSRVSRFASSGTIARACGLRAHCRAAEDNDTYSRCSYRPIENGRRQKHEAAIPTAAPIRTRGPASSPTREA
jgi:hypothetical protein